MLAKPHHPAHPGKVQIHKVTSGEQGPNRGTGANYRKEEAKEEIDKLPTSGRVSAVHEVGNRALRRKVRYIGLQRFSSREPHLWFGKLAHPMAGSKLLAVCLVISFLYIE